VHAVRLRPSGLWIGWDSQNLYWASSRELLGSTPATSRQALTSGLFADQHPWLQISAPEMGWLSVHLPQTRLPYRVGWLWPWQAWGLYRRWHRLWLLAHSRALLHQTRQLQAQCRSRYLRQAQWPSIRQQADAILSAHHQLGIRLWPSPWPRLGSGCSNCSSQRHYSVCSRAIAAAWYGATLPCLTRWSSIR